MIYPCAKSPILFIFLIICLTTIFFNTIHSQEMDINTFKTHQKYIKIRSPSIVNLHTISIQEMICFKNCKRIFEHCSFKAIPLGELPNVNLKIADSKTCIGDQLSPVKGEYSFDKIYLEFPTNYPNNFSFKDISSVKLSCPKYKKKQLLKSYIIINLEIDQKENIDLFSDYKIKCFPEPEYPNLLSLNNEFIKGNIIAINPYILKFIDTEIKTNQEENISIFSSNQNGLIKPTYLYPSCERTLLKSMTQNTYIHLPITLSIYSLTSLIFKDTEGNILFRSNITKSDKIEALSKIDKRQIMLCHLEDEENINESCPTLHDPINGYLIFSYGLQLTSIVKSQCYPHYKSEYPKYVNKCIEGDNDIPVWSDKKAVPNCYPILKSCKNLVCQNSGTCQINAYSKEAECKCKSQYYGRFCEQENNPCENNVCSPSAVCIPDEDMIHFKCVCPEGLMGFQCDKLIDEKNSCQVPEIFGYDMTDCIMDIYKKSTSKLCKLRCAKHFKGKPVLKCIFGGKLGELSGCQLMKISHNKICGIHSKSYKIEKDNKVECICNKGYTAESNNQCIKIKDLIESMNNMIMGPNLITMNIHKYRTYLDVQLDLCPILVDINFDFFVINDKYNHALSGRLFINAKALIRCINTANIHRYPPLELTCTENGWKIKDIADEGTIIIYGCNKKSVLDVSSIKCNSEGKIVMEDNYCIHFIQRRHSNELMHLKSNSMKNYEGYFCIRLMIIILFLI